MMIWLSRSTLWGVLFTTYTLFPERYTNMSALLGVCGWMDGYVCFFKLVIHASASKVVRTKINNNNNNSRIHHSLSAKAHSFLAAR
jgi:hypothetical protein